MSTIRAAGNRTFALYPVRKASFSLIELLIVFSIICAVGAVVGTRIHQNRAAMDFKATVRAIEEHMDMAKRLSRITRNETRVVIKKIESTYLLGLIGDGLPLKLKTKLSMGRPLHGLIDVQLDHQSYEICLIPFYAYGPQFPKMTLHLIGPYQTAEIDLQKYSSPADTSEKESKALYPKYYEKKD